MVPSRYLTFKSKLLIAFSSIATATIVVAASLFSQSASYHLRSEIEARNAYILSRTREQLDAMVSRIDASLIELVLDDDINRFLNKSRVEDYTVAQRMLAMLDRKRTVNQEIHSIYVVFKESAKLFSSPYGLFDVADFFDAGWRQKQISPGLLQNVMLRPLEEADGKRDVLSFTRQLPINDSTPLAHVVINVDHAQIRAMFEGLRFHPEDALAIVRADGSYIAAVEMHKLYSRLEPDRIAAIIEDGQGSYRTRDNGNNYFVSFMKSEYGPWYYLYSVSELGMFASLNSLIRLIAVGAFILLAVGIAVSNRIARTMYGPIGRISGSFGELVGETENAKDEIQKIGSGVERLMAARERLEEDLRLTLPMAREKLFSNLLAGMSLEPDLIRRELRLVGIPAELFSEYIFVLIVRATDGTALNVPDAASIDGRCWIEAINWEQIGAVIQVAAGEDPAAAVARVRGSISAVIGNDSAGVSRIHTGIERIADAYREAKEALSYRMALADRRVIDIDDLKKGNRVDRGQVLRYHDEIVKFLTVRNLTAAKDRLAALKSYLIEESASDEYVFLVFIELVNRISRLVFDLGFEMIEIVGVSNYEIIQDLRQAEGIDDLSNRLNAFMQSIAERLGELTAVRHDAVLDESIRFVREHYQENFGLEQAAERAGLSSAYFSRLFREKTGSSFVEYLTNVRVEEAKRLLRSSDLKISEIGVRVGYPNPSYFIRVFTKKTGVSPQRYKDAR